MRMHLKFFLKTVQATSKHDHIVSLLPQSQYQSISRVEMRYRSSPSPLVPLLMVLILGMVIAGPTIFDRTMLLLRGGGGDDDKGGVSLVTILPLVLLVVIHVLSVLFRPRSYSAARSGGYGGSGYDEEGFWFGFGSMLLLVIFLVLCKWF